VREKRDSKREKERDERGIKRERKNKKHFFALPAIPSFVRRGGQTSPGKRVMPSVFYSHSNVK
jgi:hypothetical protein